MTFKIGFHTGPGGNPTGIGDYFKRLDTALIPAVLMSVDHYGPCYELANLAQVSGVSHVIGFRLSTAGQNDGRDYDVPNYAISPVQAAANHWQMTVAKLPPEFDRENVWLLPVNEVDKNQSDWLGDFACAMADLALADNYKIAMFAFSPGEPEQIDWETEGMLAYLDKCMYYPDQLAIALHEYSLDPNEIRTGSPWLVGRFNQLHEVCLGYDLGLPTIFISEFGWAYNNAPATDKALSDIDWANSIYNYPNILGATTWYLGGGANWDSICNKIQKLIAPVTEKALAQGQDPEPPDPPEETLEEWIWRRSIEEQLISLNPKAALQARLFELGYTPVESEIWDTYSDTGLEFAFQAGENVATGHRIVAAAEVPHWDDVFIVSDPDDPVIPEPPGDPLEGLKIGPFFNSPYVLTSPFNAPRDYDGDGVYDDKHEGADYDILTAVADSKEPVLCGYPGKVIKAGLSSGAYGYRVVVESEYRGTIFNLWYCHLDNAQVAVGDVIALGQSVGELGNTGGNWGEHLHLNLQHQGTGLDGYVVEKVRDPSPFMQMYKEPGTYDLVEYLRGDGRLYEVRHADGSQERFQTQTKMESGVNTWFQTKNQQWEEFWFGQDHIWRGTDTSPGSGRYYTVYEDGQYGARWCKRFMNVGEVFVGESHYVQFYNKGDCSPSTPNSGFATNRTWFKAYYDQKIWNGIIVKDVIELGTSTGETMWFAKGFGLVAWYSAWGQSAISEIHAPGTRPNNVMEVIPCL